MVEIIIMLLLIALLGFIVFRNNKEGKDVIDRYIEPDNKAINLYETEKKEEEVIEEVKKEEVIEEVKEDVAPKVSKPKRARNKKGQYKGDDKTTPEVNEAWEGGVAPEKKEVAPKKPRKPRMKVSK